MTKKSNLIGKL